LGNLHSNQETKRAPRSSPISATTVPDAQQSPTSHGLNWVNILWWATLQAGVLAAPFTFTWSGLAVCLILYFLTALGITAGFHRLLTHRSFRVPRFLEYFLVILGTCANQGGPLRWAATHRVHHQHSDQDGDPHSPRHGWWWAHMLWWMPYSPTLDDPKAYQRYVLDLARDPFYRFLQNWSVLPPVLLAVLVYILGEFWGNVGLSWLVWGVFVRTVVLYHATWLINSAGHFWGYRTYNTPDGSTNVWWLAICSLGEGWHNNHHRFPRSARHGLRWWELDLTYELIRLLRTVGLARQVHLPGNVLGADTASKGARQSSEGIPQVANPGLDSV
jgi:fatty-acid desaturase